MNKNALHASFRWISFLVLAAIVATLIYSAWISLTHWSGIAV